MGRPSRCRRICAEPFRCGFRPLREESAGEVVLAVDEYEVIRLVDYEKKTHKQCAEQMGISRTTVTEMYERARYKIADSIVNGKALSISGGHYQVCQGDRKHGCGQNCRWMRQAEENTEKKGELAMRIAVTYENGSVFQHFGHTAQFKLYDVENSQIVKSQVVDTLGSGHGALAGFLSAQQVDTLICGGIGMGAQNALAQAGIQLCGGVTGEADAAVEAFLAGTLVYSTDAHCSHHEHGHHGHCGEDKHGCAGNGGKCGE